MSVVGAVVAAGAGGAVARFLVDRVVVARRAGPLPVATLLINTAGSFVLGLLVGAVASRGLRPDVETIAGTGFCGGFTTFSTFAFENVRLAGEGRGSTALAYTSLSLVLGLGLAAVGWGLMGL